ncbi:hypothetical protein DOTSEDRAFT_19031 [Dothistroma septosporum NZE10]|uniref:Uncharacterized protein n=1 Tax=Dothistroma septosporum (strain NZE10 / CBS 128990) TaxID=675120 RepID=N1Q1Y7_DOTSN|nr:hypothetical protein DOTSEDRAFT_19031 [Dothistroma septosporum NZE10]
MESQFMLVAGGFLLGCASQSYAATSVQLREEERHEIEKRIRAEATDEFQKSLEGILEAERSETEYRVKRECIDKNRKEIKRHEHDVADALRIIDQAKVSRDREVRQRVSSAKARLGTEIALRRAQYEMTQLEMKRILTEDAHTKIQRNLKSEEGRHAATRKAMGLLRDGYQALLRDIAQLQAHVKELEVGSSSTNGDIANLQKHVKKIEKNHKKRKALLEEAAKDRNALLRDNITSQETITTLRKKLEEKYEVEKKLRQATENKYNNLERQHLQRGYTLASANQRAKAARDTAAAKTEAISRLQDDMRKLRDEIGDITKENEDSAKTRASERKESNAKVSQLQSGLKSSNDDLTVEKETNKSLCKQFEELGQALSLRYGGSIFASSQGNGGGQQGDASMNTGETTPTADTPSDVPQGDDVDMDDGVRGSAPTTTHSRGTSRSSGQSSTPFNNSFGKSTFGSTPQSGPQPSLTPLPKLLPTTPNNAFGNAAAEAIPHSRSKSNPQTGTQTGSTPCPKPSPSPPTSSLGNATSQSNTQGDAKGGTKRHSSSLIVPTLDDIRGAVPMLGIPYNDLLAKFQERIEHHNCKNQFYSMTKKVTDLEVNLKTGIT